MRAPPKENHLALAAVDTGGKKTQEQGQMRVWAVPTAGTATSLVSESNLPREIWTVTYGKWKNADSWGARKNTIILKLVLDFFPLLLWLLISYFIYLSFRELFYFNHTFISFIRFYLYCGSDHELIAKFRCNWREQGKPLDHSAMT